MPEFKPEEKNLKRPLIEAFVASSGMGLFALFAHSGLPLVLLAGTGLLATALAITHSYRIVRRLADIFGLAPLTKAAPAYLILGGAVGALFGMIYRVYSDMGTLPAGLGRFVFAAALIGASEEVLFRGYIQGRLRRLGRIGAPIFAAVGHTVYKLALFTLPPEGIVIDYSFLAFWTFSGGLIIGILRELSGSVLPPLGGHVMFDVIVYGDNISAPWWVWS
jgi:membrane protease YdiL (CAAX protease family)